MYWNVHIDVQTDPISSLPIMLLLFLLTYSIVYVYRLGTSSVKKTQSWKQPTKLRPLERIAKGASSDKVAAQPSTRIGDAAPMRAPTIHRGD